MPPITPPRYISPKEREENRARWVRFAYWVVVGIPVMVGVMMLGYTDQAPRWLRETIFAIDGAFGFPVLWLIKAVAA